jgi:hypothetical protein
LSQQQTIFGKIHSKFTFFIRGSHPHLFVFLKWDQKFFRRGKLEHASVGTRPQMGPVVSLWTVGDQMGRNLSETTFIAKVKIKLKTTITVFKASIGDIPDTGSYIPDDHNSSTKFKILCLRLIQL